MYWYRDIQASFQNMYELLKAVAIMSLEEDMCAQEIQNESLA